MKATLALLLLVLTALASATPRTPKSPAELLKQIQPSLVTIAYPIAGNAGEHSNCTGFVIDAARGWVLTAKHCINPDPSGLLYVNDEERKTVRSDELFALIEVPRMTQPPLTIRAKRPAIGDPAVAIGYGFGFLTLLNGVVAAFKDDDIALDVGLIPGMSGGPMVDSYGEVIGLNQRNVTLNGGSLGVGCGVEELWKFLRAK